MTHLILPGVGHFQEAMHRVENRDLVNALQQLVDSGRPLLGVCLGMQLLASIGTEGETETSGLNYLSGRVEKLDDKTLRVPHVGWNYKQQNF